MSVPLRSVDDPRKTLMYKQPIPGHAHLSVINLFMTSQLRYVRTTTILSLEDYCLEGIKVLNELPDQLHHVAIINHVKASKPQGPSSLELQFFS